MTGNDEVKELLEAKEGENLQLKEAKKSFSYEEAAKICCALSNNGGGRLVLGISDKRPRKVVGTEAFSEPERTRVGLINKLKVNVDFCTLTYDGKRILIFSVNSRPIGLPVQFDGTAWIYEADELKVMSEEIRHRIYSEAGNDFSSQICKEATINDLDDRAVENFRTKWMEKSENKKINLHSKEQLLIDSGAVTDKGVTYAAIILFGTDKAVKKYLPQSEIIFEYRSSEASGPASQREEIKEGFFLSFDRIWNLINLRNDKQHYQEGLFVFDVPTFNERVVREGLLNAVSHRDYQMGGSIFIRQYRDRIVIESPGGLPYGITLDNIIDRQFPRNRRIAEILALSGLVERSGQGMNLMYELSVQEAKPLPDFCGTDNYFVNLTLNGIVIDKEMISVIKRICDKYSESLSTLDFLIIDALYNNKKLNDKMYKRINHLVDIGIVEHIGRRKYILAQSLYKSVGKAGVHTRIAGLDRNTNKELILKHIRDNNDTGATFNELSQVIPNLDDNQLKGLVRELKNEGKIYCKGKTKGARWFVN